jgi:general stress protein CsbA
VKGYEAAFLGAWALVAACVLAVLIGAFTKPGYLQMFLVVVMEALLVVWLFSLSKLPWE